MLQLLKTLHLPYTELIDSINKEVIENPALEFEKQDELIAYAKTLADSKVSHSIGFDESMPDREIKDQGPSLQDYLEEQIRLEDLEEKELHIAKYLIANIDEKGYIKDYPVIRREVMQKFGVKSCNVDKTLEIIQTLEPEGVGARNLKECLLIQINEFNFESDALQDVIYKTIKYHFEKLAKKKYKEIAEELELEEEGVKHIAEFIEKNLNPAPGYLYRNDRQEQTIIPSFIIKEDEETLENKFIYENLEETKGPRLKINFQYLRMLENKETDDETRTYLKEKLEAAKIFIDNINKRQNTVNNIIKIITSSQQDFFEKGYFWLQPLQQNNLASQVGVHPSTISRAVSTKYAETPQGLYPLKHMCPRNFKGYTSMQIKGMMRSL